MTELGDTGCGWLGSYDTKDLAMAARREREWQDQNPENLAVAVHPTHPVPYYALVMALGCGPCLQLTPLLTRALSGQHGGRTSDVCSQCIHHNWVITASGCSFRILHAQGKPHNTLPRTECQVSQVRTLPGMDSNGVALWLISAVALTTAQPADGNSKLE